jgi:arylsulfatase A-like enzyme
MRRPNLLFLYTDEQAYDTLAAYGNRRIQMPHLNRLAADATVFERAYVTQPVCTPSRSTLLTGQWPHENGCTENNVPIRAETRCLPEMLTGNGYVTGHFGKWHLGNEIFPQHGFQDWRAIDDGYYRYYSADRPQDARSAYHHFLVRHGFEPGNGSRFTRPEAARLPEEYGKPAFLAGEASEFIRQHKDEPFVLYVNFFEPHMPYYGPRDGQYALSEVGLPASFAVPPTAEQPLKTRAYREGYRDKGHSGLPLVTERDWRTLRSNYWGLCSLVDTHAGRILDTLRELELYDDTIIVFTSDHGDMMGAHQLTAKCVMFEESTRVPMLVKGAGQKRGSRVTGPMSQIDVVPTLLELLGAPRNPQCQGRSLAQYVGTSGNAALDQDVFVEWQGPNSGVVWEGGTEDPWVPTSMQDSLTPERLGRHILDPVRSIVTADGFKLNLSTLGENELYDLDEDPGETRNLIAAPEHRSLVEELTSRIRAWQEESGDPALHDPGFANPEGW